MTARIIALAASLPRGLRARPWPAFALTLALAYGGGLWLNVLHTAEGGYERNEPPLLLHWLRDATLALPLILAPSGSACWSPAGSSSATAQAQRGPASAAVLRARGSACRRSASPGARRARCTPRCSSAPRTAATSSRCRAPRPRRRCSRSPSTCRSPLLVAFALRAHAARGPRRASRTGCRPVSSGQRCAPPGRARLRPARARRDLRAAGAELADRRRRRRARRARRPRRRSSTSTSAPSTSTSRSTASATTTRGQDVRPRRPRLDRRPRRGAAAATSRSACATTPIQPLVIRANQGDCVEINVHQPGRPAATSACTSTASPSTSPPRATRSATTRRPPSATGESRTYRYWVPREPADRGRALHAPRPGQPRAGQPRPVRRPGGRARGLDVLRHGHRRADLSPAGRRSIVPGNGQKAFREYVQLYHEIGNEDLRRSRTSDGGDLPTVDPHTTAYRPGSRAINYRSEPFMNRLDALPEDDGARLQLLHVRRPGDPDAARLPGRPDQDPHRARRQRRCSTSSTCTAAASAGGYNPQADTTFDYAGHRPEQAPEGRSSASPAWTRSPSGPGESYNLEIEGGAGGVQQGAGEFLFHCHIAEHYVAAACGASGASTTPASPTSSRCPTARRCRTPVDSTRPHRQDDARRHDAHAGQPRPTGSAAAPAAGRAARQRRTPQVWDWQIDSRRPTARCYLGEPEEKESWPGNAAGDGIHELPATRPVPGRPPVGPQDRPEDPVQPDQRPPGLPAAAPAHRQAHRRSRPTGTRARRGSARTPTSRKTTGDAPDPWANRKDGICPADAPTRTFNVVGIELPDQGDAQGDATPTGKIFVLAKDKADVLAGRKPAEPLAIRANIGDCVASRSSTR